MPLQLWGSFKGKGKKGKKKGMEKEANEQRPNELVKCRNA